MHLTFICKLYNIIYYIYFEYARGGRKNQPIPADKRKNNKMNKLTKKHEAYMKYKKIIAFILMISACVLSSLFVACGKGDNEYADKVKVVYELEGGTYKTSDHPIIIYYPFEKGTENLILNPEELKEINNGREIVHSGKFEIEGWYKNKIETDDGKAEYSDKWDFDTDKVTDAGVTLYAKWVPKIIYSYGLYYRDKDGEHHIYSYEVKEGDKFEDYMNKAKIFGSGSDKKTGLGTFKDKDGKEFDMNTKHPGGNESFEIKIFVDYIDGEFALVSTAEELKKAKSKNIYLLNDIDLGGEEFTFASSKDYSCIIEGNGHSIKNFALDYYDDKDSVIDGTLNISLFGNMENAEIKNVSFENVNITIDTKAFYSRIKEICFAPIAITAKNTVIENVKFSGEYKVQESPTENIITEFESPIFNAEQNETNKIIGNEITVTVAENKE